MIVPVVYTNYMSASVTGGVNVNTMQFGPRTLLVGLDVTLRANTTIAGDQFELQISRGIQSGIISAQGQLVLTALSLASSFVTSGMAFGALTKYVPLGVIMERGESLTIAVYATTGSATAIGIVQYSPLS